MQFTSRIAAYQAIIRNEERQYFPDGNHRVVRPEVTADFAEEAVDETYRGQEGEPDYVAMRGGGFFDSDVAAKRHGWTDKEKQACEERLLEIAAKEGDVKVYEPAKPTAPWNTYDSQHPEAVLGTAIATGLGQEALMYEERTLQREDLMEQLRSLVADERAENELTAA